MTRPNAEDLAAILDRFELAWEAGASPAIEDFYPQPNNADRSFLGEMC